MAKFWSAEEVEYLEENWGIKSIPNIAKNINRTVAAVKAKAIKLELGEYNNSGIYITFNQLVKALGYNQSYSWILERYSKHGCPIKTKKKLNHV